MNDESLLLRCDCSCEVLCVEKIKDISETNPKIVTKETYFTIFEKYNKKENFFNRLGYSIKYLITGKKYHDQIILCDNKVKQLIEFLKED